MKTKITMVIAGVVLLAGVLLLHRSDEGGLDIGVLSFMTGQYSKMGIDMVNGVVLACEAARTNGTRVTLHVEDGKAEAKASMFAFNKLLRNHLDATIVAGDNQVPVVAPLILKNKIPTVATIISNSKFLEYNNDDVWIFRNWISVSSMARTIAEFAHEKLKLKKIAIIKLRAEFGDESESAFRQAVRGSDVEIVSTDSYLEADVNVRTILVKAFAKQPDGVFVAGYGNGYNIILNQIRELGYKGVVLTGDAVMNPDCYQGLKDFSNVYFTRFVEPTNATYKAFCDLYEKRFGSAPSVYSAYGFDSVQILLFAFSGSPNSSVDARNNLFKVHNMDCLLGKLTLLKNGDCTIPVAVHKFNSTGEAVVTE